MEKTATKITERTIIVKPCEGAGFSGQSSYPGTGQAIEGAQIAADGTFKTGLTRDEEIKFCDELGLPVGTLSKNNEDFWGSVLNLRLPRDKDTRIVVRTLRDEIKYRALIANDKIAENELKINHGISQYYIEDKEAKAEVEEKIFNTKMEALLALRDMTMAEKRSYLSLYNKRGIDKMTDTFVNTQIIREAEGNPTKFISLVEDPDVKVRIEIQKLLQNKVLLKRSGTYFFESEAIGSTLDEVVVYFKDVRNQAIQMQAKSLSKKKDKKKSEDKED